MTPLFTYQRNWVVIWNSCNFEIKFFILLPRIKSEAADMIDAWELNIKNMSFSVVVDSHSHILAEKRDLHTGQVLYFPKEPTLRIEHRCDRLFVVERTHPSEWANGLSQDSCPVTCLPNCPVCARLTSTEHLHWRRWKLFKSNETVTLCDSLFVPLEYLINIVLRVETTA
jgi:hypothetical protein